MKRVADVASGFQAIARGNGLVGLVEETSPNVAERRKLEPELGIDGKLIVETGARELSLGSAADSQHLDAQRPKPVRRALRSSCDGSVCGRARIDCD
jgi:hypothetical protein